MLLYILPELMFCHTMLTVEFSPWTPSGAKSTQWKETLALYAVWTFVRCIRNQNQQKYKPQKIV